MAIIRSVLALCIAVSIYATETCFFIPPKGWEIANPELWSPSVNICFLGKGAKGSPTINLATEPVNVSLDAYVEEVRKIHASDPNSRWRDLGKYKTLLGDGRLTELESPTQGGMTRMVQLIVIKDQTAYILTASALKDEFSRFYKTFDQTLRSLQWSSNLVESYASKEGRLSLIKLIREVEQTFEAQLAITPELDVSEAIQSEFNEYYSSRKKNRRILNNIIEKLEQKLKAASCSREDAEFLFLSDEFQENIWIPFQKKIINDFTEMGPYWQILILKDVQSKLLTMGSSL